MKKTRLIVLLIFTAAVICALSFSFSSVADNTSPVLYRNDTKYTITEYPVEVKDGTVYAPVSFFVGLNGIEYEFDRKNSSFYLRNKSTGRFFSFSFNVEGIVVDNTFTTIVFPLMNSTVYLPLETCADILSLKIEKIHDWGIDRIRLSDGSEKLTFKELIELYDPSEGPDDPSVINPVDPNNPNPDLYADRYLYITVESDGGNGCEEILDILRDWGKKATFFFTPEGIKNNPLTVIRAFAENHSIGLKCSPEELEEANRTLYEALGFCSRLLRLPDSYDLSEKEKKELNEKGYVLWGFTKESTAPEKNTWAVARDLYNSTFINDITVLKLTDEEYNGKVLTQILYFLSDDKYITARVIEPTTPEI
ncbi:MAG: hypothetical protein IJ323_02990 [Clostridia bacterium]|nr:hypothetical protein [Clostridia bacterium]